MSQIEHIQERIRKFRDERDWMQFHNPKNLACSISIEAAELLEHFQWKTPAEAEKLSQEKLGEISHELADIAVYVLEMADNLKIGFRREVHGTLNRVSPWIPPRLKADTSDVPAIPAGIPENSRTNTRNTILQGSPRPFKRCWIPAKRQRVPIDRSWFRKS
jgi:dCTP diphosphatase